MSAIVLVIEDNPVSARLVEHILEAAGYSVVVAARLDTARSILEQRSDIGIVVCDIELPDGNGLDLAAELLAKSKLPIVMCTSADDQASVHAALEIGCAGYVLKPINATRLLERVTASLTKEKDPKAASQPAAKPPKTAPATAATEPATSEPAGPAPTAEEPAA